jgi:hypothetical protein
MLSALRGTFGADELANLMAAGEAILEEQAVHASGGL